MEPKTLTDTVAETATNAVAFIPNLFNGTTLTIILVGALLVLAIAATSLLTEWKFRGLSNRQFREWKRSVGAPR